MSPPPSVASLPLELLEEIADTLDLNTQLSLCCVSKVFHSLTIKSIYRVICLESPSIVVACCRTLASNRTAAAAVRQFSITYTPAAPFSVHYFDSFYSIIRRALQRASHLQELKLLVSDSNFVQVLLHTRFHSLRHFECYLPLTDSLILFLNNHPTIIYLQIAPNVPITPSSSDVVLPQVRLPKLQYFVGNSDCVSALVAGASLRAAFLFWETIDGALSETIKSLARSSGDTINLVSCRRRGWNLDLIHLITVWLPDIYALIITNLLSVDSRPTKTYLNAIANLLSRFSMLRRLHLHCIDTWKVSDVQSSLDDDYTTVTAWGAACPSLVECILPRMSPLCSSRTKSLSSLLTRYTKDSDGMVWMRRHGLWVPDPNDIEGIKWTYTTLYSNKYPKWSHLLVTHKNRLHNQDGYDNGHAVLKSLLLAEFLDEQ